MNKLENKLIDLGYINYGLTSVGYRYIKNNSIVLYYNKKIHKIIGYNIINTTAKKIIEILNDDLYELRKEKQTIW